MSFDGSGSIREVALAFRGGVPHLDRVAQGIRQYAHARANWRFLIGPETHDLSPLALEGWNGDGVIAMCNTDEEEERLLQLPCPVINISGVLRESRIPRIRNDYREIGRAAARHLRQRRFRRFGFYGVADVWYSAEIEAGFREEVGVLGFSVESHLCSSSFGEVQSWDQGQDELEQWLKGLGGPTGILAAHDPRATMVIHACERVGLGVPEDVAVIGVNDDTMTCETIRPSLSSIDRDSRSLGVRVAETLDAMMRGVTFGEEIVLPPGGVVERDSTKTLVIGHPALAAAVDLIYNEFQRPISVDDLAMASGKSRRWLEDAFRRELECSPAGLLSRVRVEQPLVRLEADDSFGLGELAAQRGFSGTRHMNQTFLREKGNQSPEFEAISVGNFFCFIRNQMGEGDNFP